MFIKASHLMFTLRNLQIVIEGTCKLYIHIYAFLATDFICKNSVCSLLERVNLWY